MPAPHNRFKRALLSGQRQLGLWVALANPISAELCARAGFDWLLLDGEHGPNDVRSILHQLQAVSAYPGSPVVRIPVADATHIKQMLDIGAQTLLVPMVDTPDQAITMAKAMRYPPLGTRGIGAALARASGFNLIPDYLQTADAEVCLLVQAEARKSIENLEAIAATEGVDGVFIGPSDLAADMEPRQPRSYRWSRTRSDASSGWANPWGFLPPIRQSRSDISTRVPPLSRSEPMSEP